MTRRLAMKVCDQERWRLVRADARTHYVRGDAHPLSRRADDGGACFLGVPPPA